MSRSSFRTVSVALAVLTASAHGSVVLASHATSTASVSPRDLTAGASGVPVVMTVSHPSAGVLGAPALNVITIAPPDQAHSLVSGSASGWTATPVSGGIRFSGGTLEAGQTQQFSLIADAATTPADACGDWRVSVSADGGGTSASASPAVAGALTSCVRVLEAAAELLGPAGAADGTVTAGQEVCVRVRTRNAASASLRVTPGVAGSGFASGVPLVAGESACGGSPLPGAGIDLAPGASVSTDHEITFGAGSSATLWGSAAAEGGSARQGSQIAFSIQPAPAFSYVIGSLVPQAMNPAKAPGPVSFSLQLIQTVASAPAVTLHPGTSLSFESFGPVVLPDSVQVAPGATVSLTFPPETVPILQDRRYPMTVGLSGTDTNQASLAVELILPGVKLDRGLPVVEATLSPPNSQVPGTKPAVKDGDTLRFGGQIRDIDDNGMLVKCPGCRVDHARLVQFRDAGCSEVTASDLDVTVTASAGNLSGSYTGAYHSTTRCVMLAVWVWDQVDNYNAGLSAALEVDNIAPKVTSVTTAIHPQTGRRAGLRASFDEPVAGPSCALDWLVQDEVGPNPVLPETQGPNPSSMSALREFSDDAAGLVTYRPAQLTCGSVVDRVGHPPGPGTAALFDGLAPTAPRIESVDGKAAEGDGAFRFETDSPQVTLTNPPASGDHAVRSGYIARVYEETNGVVGLQADEDRKMCGDTSQGTSVTLQCDFGFPRREATVYAVVIDVNGNLGVPTQARFIFR